ncbi:hypothetical protein B6N60_02498 [Richelia sinica FACHB-800]|uniref:Uncharacterized protein n=1 Tax=Richelia sinica FACHB-800 TaxID=1357546 RepID=A0A975T983_9NOST|nr:hypothetical protein B6N60_02498 [Richelia sinica FACHB-800]
MGSNGGFDAQSEPLTPSSEPMKQLAYFKLLFGLNLHPGVVSVTETPEFLDVRD